MFPPIVFLHGFLGDRDSYAEVIAGLDADRPTLCPSLFGHGGQPEAGHHDFDTEVQRLAALVRDEYGDRPVHIVGYSLGGRLALTLLVRAPHLFRSATLISTRRGLDDPRLRLQRLEQDRAWAAMLENGPLPEFLDLWENSPLFATQRELEVSKLIRLREQRLRHDRFALARAVMALSLGQMPSLEREVARITCPVVLMVGGRDSKFRELAADLAQQIPNSRTIVVSGAGHNLPLERPAAVAAAINEGIEHVED